MRRTTAMVLLGLVVAAATNARGDGAIIIGNYQEPYNPVVWFPGYPVRSADGVDLTLWYGEGVLQNSYELTDNVPLTWNALAENNGYAGYYDFTEVRLPDWQPGDIYTFQIVASGVAFAVSPLWTESSDIQDVGGDPPGLPGISHQSIGFRITPAEPSTFALLGLGGCSFFVRRRNC